MRHFTTAQFDVRVMLRSQRGGRNLMSWSRVDLNHFPLPNPASYWRQLGASQRDLPVQRVDCWFARSSFRQRQDSLLHWLDHTREVVWRLFVRCSSMRSDVGWGGSAADVHYSNGRDCPAADVSRRSVGFNDRRAKRFLTFHRRLYQIDRRPLACMSLSCHGHACVTDLTMPVSCVSSRRGNNHPTHARILYRRSGCHMVPRAIFNVHFTVWMYVNVITDALLDGALHGNMWT